MAYRYARIPHHGGRRSASPHEAARKALGTVGLSATVNTALSRVARDPALAEFDVTREIDGSPDEVEANRTERVPGTSG